MAARSQRDAGIVAQSSFTGTEQTILFVTHDVQEAVTIADRVLLLERDCGQIREEIPIELDRPRGRSAQLFQCYCSRLHQGTRQ